MVRYIARRLLTMIPVLLLISIVTFVVMNRVIGDPVLMMIGQDAALDDEAIERMREEMGFNRPLPLQYLQWLGHLVTGDFGRSFRLPMPVTELVLDRLPVTLQLSFMALALGVLLALPLGILAALRPGSIIDLGVSLIAVATLSIPNFWLGILLIYFFALLLGWMPSGGFVPFSEDPVGNLKFMALPTITLSTYYVGALARYTRSTMVEILSQDYIRTARAKGLRQSAVVVGHSFRNGLIPIVTVIALEMANLLGGAVVTESVFSLPGVGTLLVQSILGRDMPVVQGIILLVAAAVIVINLVTDITYAFIDPRIRTQ